MKILFRRVLKLSAGLLCILLVVAGVLIALNFTLLKNLPSAQDGAIDAMYIANQKPLQSVQGREGKTLNVKPASDNKFNAAHENWEQTGG